MKPVETTPDRERERPHGEHGDGIPRSDADVRVRALRVQVAWACRILAMGGHADLTLGHVSARRAGVPPSARPDTSPDAPPGIYMKRFGVGLNEVTPDDVLTIDLEGRKLAGPGEVHLEAVFHTEAYRARPDVGAVLHTHPPFATALGATRARLALLSHEAVLFKDGLPIFEETAELITRPEQGRAVAAALGSHKALLLCNHGVLVVGKSVPEAVFTALTLERAVQIQAIASALGPLRPMSEAMAGRLYPSKYRDEFVDNYWQYLIREVRRKGLDDGMPD